MHISQLLFKTCDSCVHAFQFIPPAVFILSARNIIIHGRTCIIALRPMFDISSHLCALCFHSINTFRELEQFYKRATFKNKLLCVCRDIDQIAVKFAWLRGIWHWSDGYETSCTQSRCQSHEILQLNRKNCAVIQSTSFTARLVVCRKVSLFVEWLCINIYKSSDRLKCFNVKSTLFHKHRVWSGKRQEKSWKKTKKAKNSNKSSSKFQFGWNKNQFRVFIVVCFTLNVGFFRLSREIISVKWNNDISIKQSSPNELQFSACFEVFVEFRGRKHTPTRPDEVVFESFAAQIKRQWWMAVKHWHSFPISVGCQAQSLNHPLTRHVEKKLIIHALWQSSFESLLILLMN